jgi:hypothetical protein
VGVEEGISASQLDSTTARPVVRSSKLNSHSPTFVPNNNFRNMVFSLPSSFEIGKFE